MTLGQYLALVRAAIERRVGKDESYELVVHTKGGLEARGPWEIHGTSILRVGEWYIDVEAIEAIALGDAL